MTSPSLANVGPCGRSAGLASPEMPPGSPRGSLVGVLRVGWIAVELGAELLAVRRSNSTQPGRDRRTPRSWRGRPACMLPRIFLRLRPWPSSRRVTASTSVAPMLAEFVDRDDVAVHGPAGLDPLIRRSGRTRTSPGKPRGVASASRRFLRSLWNRLLTCRSSMLRRQSRVLETWIGRRRSFRKYSAMIPTGTPASVGPQGTCSGGSRSGLRNFRSGPNVRIASLAPLRTVGPGIGHSGVGLKLGLADLPGPRPLALATSADHRVEQVADHEGRSAVEDGRAGDLAESEYARPALRSRSVLQVPGQVDRRDPTSPAPVHASS